MVSDSARYTDLLVSTMHQGKIKSHTNSTHTLKINLMFRVEFNGMNIKTEGRVPDATLVQLTALVCLFVKRGQQQSQLNQS